MDILKAWLKLGTVAHYEDVVGEKGHSCARHLIKFGLLNPIKVSTRSNPRQITCICCQVFHNIISNITHVLKEGGADKITLAVVTDWHANLELFLGHHCRVLNQQRAML
ncbi:hypothetical protein PHMEG_00020910 [Phytophthora megakarya]|uniref:Uncharacterized protein n=1 Tax=Phytophthora megakarya TaxID=4795 RepID=A0A225VN79_9STRA|nr:hypothetical protein PHMEG_00020910 [Phytophthora megakarya]